MEKELEKLRLENKRLIRQNQAYVAILERAKGSIESRRNVISALFKQKEKQDLYLNLLLAHNTDIGIIFDANGKFINATNKFLKYIDVIHVDSLQGMFYEKIFDKLLCGKPSKELRTAFKKCIKDKLPINIEKSLEKNEVITHWSVKFTPLWDNNKKYMGVMVMCHEITDIIDAKKEAENANRAKSVFLANMSHEIRTPMNGILGILHILEQSQLNESQKKHLDKCIFSAENLTRIINDILDFSKIEAGKLEMEEYPFTLKSIFQDVKDLYEAVSNDKGLNFNVETSGFDDTYILGDALRLKQILFNFVSNAIKFTEKGTVSLKVESSLVENNLNCKFSVRDTGIGLKKEQVQNLFSAFSQADTSITRKYGGTGLGLVISKNIIKLMGGDIWVESEFGSGSTFYCTADFKLASDLVLASEQFEVSENKIQVQAEKKYHLLLVEDNDINQFVAQEILQSIGYTLDIASHGQEALEMLEKNTYDAVLMDIQMPVMDGYTATKIIRSQEKYSELPVIAMSANAMVGDKEISLSYGMNDHVTKPINPTNLGKVLNYWISQSKRS